ncbi:MAG: phosphoribosylformylglycinamidine synthase subunit PurS [Acidobacteriota bacterium]
MKARVIVKFKEGVLDPQGQTIRRSLNKLGHQQIARVRQGKYFEIEFEGVQDVEKARELIEQIAQGVLSNPIIENFEIEDIS